MIKIILVGYEEIETYLNKPWYTFLSNYKDSFIFKYTVKDEKKITTETNTEKFFNMSIQEIENYSKIVAEKMNLDFEVVKNKISNFREYWTEQSEWSIKCRWQKEKTFEVPKRLKRRFDNDFNNTIKKNTINSEKIWRL